MPVTRNSNPGGTPVVTETHETPTQPAPSDEYQRFENLAGRLVQVGKGSSKDKS
jgi:hypothetical protein